MISSEQFRDMLISKKPKKLCGFSSDFPLYELYGNRIERISRHRSTGSTEPTRDEACKRVRNMHHECCSPYENAVDAGCSSDRPENDLRER